MACGTVTGPATLDHHTASSAGRRLLVRASGFMLVGGLLVALVVNGVPALMPIISSLLPMVLVLGMILLVFRVILSPLLSGSRRNRSGPSILGSATRGTARGAGRVLAAPLRWAGGEDQTIEVRRFRVITVEGEVLDCELLGEQLGAGLRQGDIVEVYGRRTRHGTIRAREVVVTTNGARITARHDAAYLVARAANVLAVIALVGVAVFILYLITGLGA